MVPYLEGATWQPPQHFLAGGVGQQEAAKKARVAAAMAILAIFMSVGQLCCLQIARNRTRN